jgi:hypothetical protein
MRRMTAEREEIADMTQTTPKASDTRTALTDLAKHLREGDWNLRAPQEMADMIAHSLDALATLAAADAVPVADPIHQWQRFDGAWVDCTADKLQIIVANGMDLITRTLYAHPQQAAVPAEAASPPVAGGELTDEQCDVFRRLPLPFNDMVRAIHTAGHLAGEKSSGISDADLNTWGFPTHDINGKELSFFGRIVEHDRLDKLSEVNLPIQERCRIALACIPSCGYRDNMARLFDDLLATAARATRPAEPDHD